MSYAYKEAVVSTARESTAQLTPRQLMTAQSISAKNKRGIATGAVAGRLERDYVFRQLAAARQVFQNISVLHYSLDGVAAAGEHNDFFVAFEPKQNFGYVGPPQVVRNT